MGAKMVPMTTSEHLIAHMTEQLAGFSATPFDNPIQQADAVLCCAAFTLGSVTENEIRQFLTAAGLPLTDYPTWEICQDVASVWVAGGGIEISDLFSPSLVDCDTPLVRRLADDPELKNRIEQVYFEGKLFRDFIVSQGML